MSSSTQKGNIGRFLLILAVLAFIFIITLIVQSMITEGIPAGKYNNPNVSTYIVEGSILDTNGRALSVEVPTFNCYFDLTQMNSAQLELAVETTAFYANISGSDIKNKLNNTYKSFVQVSSNIDEKAVEEFQKVLEKYNLSKAVVIEKGYTRSYPSLFHASQLVAEVERNMNNVISPRPGYNKATTYGDNIYLTIDIDVQYIIDLAVQDLYSIIPSEYVYAFVVNANNGNILGMSTYPFYDLNSEEIDINKLYNVANVSEINGVKTNFIDKITDKDGNTLFKTTEFDISNLDFTVDYNATVESLNNEKYSVISSVPALEKPKYYIAVGVVNPENPVDDYISKTAAYIADGLKSQSKMY